MSDEEITAEGLKRGKEKVGKTRLGSAEILKSSEVENKISKPMES